MNKKDKHTGRKIMKEIIIDACGTFGAISKAEDMLKQQGFIVGSMSRNSPIGFARADTYTYIAEWRNILPNEYRKLSGIITSDDFREGAVKIIYFEDRKVKE